MYFLIDVLCHAHHVQFLMSVPHHISFPLIWHPPLSWAAEPHQIAPESAAFVLIPPPSVTQTGGELSSITQLPSYVPCHLLLFPYVVYTGVIQQPTKSCWRVRHPILLTKHFCPQIKDRRQLLSNIKKVEKKLRKFFQIR